MRIVSFTHWSARTIRARIQALKHTVGDHPTVAIGSIQKAVEEANAALLKCGPPDIENNEGSTTDCAVCLVRRRDAVLAPCGHMCACYRCDSRLERRGERCPICSAPIASVVKVFA